MSPEPRDLPAAGATARPPGSDRPAGAAGRPPPGVGAEVPAEEVELWWGSYAGWTMTPSFVVCLVLTGLASWAAWYFVPRGWVQMSALGAASAIWLVQLARWGYRYFGYNYRLTTRRLFVLRGVRRLTIMVVDLVRVDRVRVKRNWLERQVHVGRILVEGGACVLVVLEGVYQPQRTADLIWEAIQRARG